MIDGFKQTVETITGAVPPTCPWACFEDPLVYDVTKAAWWLSEEAAHVGLGDDPPNILKEGLEEFSGALNACENERWRRLNEQRKQAAAAKSNGKKR